jgi:hypothetical protein
MISFSKRKSKTPSQKSKKFDFCEGERVRGTTSLLTHLRGSTFLRFLPQAPPRHTASLLIQLFYNIHYILLA